MDAKERTALIKRYRDGHSAVVDALQGLSEEELDCSASGEWTARMVAHHLADSEMTSAKRLRRLIAEDHPVIHGYDEVEFARKLTSDRAFGPSIEVMHWARESTTQILERLTEAEWHRAGTHSESCPYSVEDWLTLNAKHGRDHAKQIERSRGRS